MMVMVAAAKHTMSTLICHAAVIGSTRSNRRGNANVSGLASASAVQGGAENNAYTIPHDRLIDLRHLDGAY